MNATGHIATLSIPSRLLLRLAETCNVIEVKIATLSIPSRLLLHYRARRMLPPSANCNTLYTESSIATPIPIHLHRHRLVLQHSLYRVVYCYDPKNRYALYNVWIATLSIPSRLLLHHAHRAIRHQQEHCNTLYTESSIATLLLV